VLVIARHDRKGLLLDLDGTLADNLCSMQAIYYAFLSDAGAQGSPSEFDRLNGIPIREVVNSLKTTHGLLESSENLLKKYWLMVQRINLQTPPTMGAVDLLREARDRNRHIAVVTSSPRLLAEEWLSRHELSGQIDAVVGGDEVELGKPAPAPYILGLARINSEASNSMAVEDSPLGAAAAIAAGIPTFGLCGHRDGLAWPPGTKFVSSLLEVIDLL
jgi:HAD superfamily hydrolase (TIGR01509 family)